MKNSLETKLGVFVVLVVLAAWAIIETLGSGDLFSSGYRVSAQFDTVQDLKVGDRVKMAGVEIGRVVDITLTTNRVSVVMKLHTDAVVKTDSKATVKFTGLMGQNFVAIGFGSQVAPMAAEGTILESTEQPDLSAIMTKLDAAAGGIQNITKTFSGDKLDNILGPLTDFVKQNSAPLTATIANVKNISSQIAAGQGTVGKLVYDDSLYNSALTTVTNLQDTAAEAKDMIATAKTVMNNVSAGQGTIGKLLTDDKLYYSTEAAMTNVNEILQKVNQGQGTIGKLVNNDDLLKNAKLSLQKLDKAADSLEDTGPLTVIGTMMTQLF
ncbi:MAG TPA: MlaD family protein [Verrucomicrobiae bacterium]|jgi:phospholipid/cholesterol/gamma-HCH transport system substrate-binding protein